EVQEQERARHPREPVPHESADLGRRRSLRLLLQSALRPPGTYRPLSYPLVKFFASARTRSWQAPAPGGDGTAPAAVRSTPGRARVPGSPRDDPGPTER